MRSCFGTELFPASFHFFFFCQFLFPVAISSISLKTKVLDLAQQMCADAGAFFAFRVRGSPVGISFGSRLGKGLGLSRSRSVLSGVEE
jgi:hypothetical protein